MFTVVLLVTKIHCKSSHIYQGKLEIVIAWKLYGLMALKFIQLQNESEKFLYVSVYLSCDLGKHTLSHNMWL